MPPHRRTSRPGPLVALLVWPLIATGCSANPITAPPPTIAPARPAVSPPPAQPPAGTVRPLPGRPSAAVFDADTSQLVVLSPGADPQAPAAVTLLGAGAPRAIELPGPASALAGDSLGNAYLSTRGGYFTVALGAARIERFDVDDAGDVEFTAIARRADDKMVLGSADGAVYAVTPGGDHHATVVTRTRMFAQVDAIVTQGDTSVVLDRGQTSVTTIGADGSPRQALRAGQGATTLVADPRGVVLAADTRGGELLVYGVDPLILRQAYPVPEAPYGLAGSRELVWVSQTATNTVVGYDLATGIPVEKVRYPTVRQPNAMAFDDTSGTLYVVSGVGEGVQSITNAADAG